MNEDVETHEHNWYPIEPLDAWTCLRQGCKHRRFNGAEVVIYRPEERDALLDQARRDAAEKALAPVLALADEWGTTYAAQRLRAAVASGGRDVNEDALGCQP